MKERMPMPGDTYRLCGDSNNVIILDNNYRKMYVKFTRANSDLTGYDLLDCFTKKNYFSKWQKTPYYYDLIKIHPKNLIQEQFNAFLIS